MSQIDPLLAPIPGADTRQLNGAQVDVAPAGCGRIKRVIYQPGFRWSTHMKQAVGTDLCMHAHVGFIARGSIGNRAAGSGHRTGPRGLGQWQRASRVDRNRLHG